MKFKESQAFRRMNASKEAFFAKRNAKRGHISHFQVWLNESLPKKILGVGLAGAAVLTIAGVLKDGPIEGTESGREGLSAIPEAIDNTRNCVMGGVLGCLNEPSTTSAPTDAETTATSVEASGIYCTGEVETVTVIGESGRDILGEIAVRNEGSSATPEQILAGPFWDVNSTFDPAMLQDGDFYYVQGGCVDDSYGG